MNKNNCYSIVATQNREGYQIKNDFNQLMETHLDKVYTPLPKAIAEILIADMNDILAQDIYPDPDNQEITLSPEEVINHPQFKEIRKQQESTSFSVSVHNTLLSIENEQDFDLELEKVLHWDLLFRMSPGPTEKMEQVAAADAALQWLGKDWTDLPANYASSIQEMKENEISFVDEKVISRLNTKLSSMNLIEKIAVWYLYEFFQRFSITLPILWVKGIIDGISLENSYYVFTSELTLDEIPEIRKEEGGFLQHRLRHLHNYLDTYR
ncbi:MAG: hypothetical protein ACQEW9_04885 [Bacteroidota bacterium]